MFLYSAHATGNTLYMDPNTQQGQGGTDPQMLTIGGEQFTPEQATELLGKGKLAQEFEKKWNSPIDSLASAYGKSQTELKARQEELEQARMQISQYEAKKDAGTDNGADLTRAREAAKKIGIVLDEDTKGWVRKDELQKYIEDAFSQREAVNKILSEAEHLEKEYTGEDGRPKFNKRIVMAYANTYNIPTLQKAYEEMHEAELKAWQDTQLAEKKNPSLKTFKSGGAKLPNRPKLNNDNLAAALQEVMS